ncbi:MAG: hypothetical protein WAN11_12760, partial [Syntrophobacteraceae bacterium]
LVIRRYEGSTDVKEVVRKVNEGLVPLISQHQGFIAYYAVDSGGGVATSISVFLNQAAAEESHKKASDWVRQNLASLLPKPPQVTAGEVVAYKK